MLKKLAHAGLGLAVAGAMIIATVPQAEARGGRTAGIVAGTIIGLGVLGAYAHAHDHGYYRTCHPGRRYCEVIGQRCWHNRYGEHVCKDDVRCHRPTVCH